QLFGHLVHRAVRLFALTHENRKAHAVRRSDAVMLVVDEQQLVAWPRVGEANSARIARGALVGDAADSTACHQLLVGQCKQIGELMGWQATDTKAHHRSSIVSRRV